MDIQWRLEASHEIEKLDGEKPPLEAATDAIQELINENISAFAYYIGQYQPSCDPKESMEFARMRLSVALSRLTPTTKEDS